jgi:hypothetical protein
LYPKILFSDKHSSLLFNDDEEEEKRFISSTLDCQQHFLQVFFCPQAPNCPNRFSCYGVTSLNENCLAYFKRFCIVPALFISVFTQVEQKVEESLLVGVKKFQQPRVFLPYSACSALALLSAELIDKLGVL